MLLLIWIKVYQHPNQHGFTPGKGTTTAWDQIHSDVIPSKYIYEFDFDKYFDRVNLDYLNETLKGMGIPNELANLMVHWSRIFLRPCGLKKKGTLSQITTPQRIQ